MNVCIYVCIKYTHTHTHVHRYADPTNPEGDLQAMSNMRDILEPDVYICILFEYLHTRTHTHIHTYTHTHTHMLTQSILKAIYKP